MIRRLLAIVFLFSTYGCSGFSGNCVPRALYQASARVLQQKQKIRFAVSHISKGTDHIQVQFLKDGVWQWSTQSEDVIQDGHKDFSSVPYKYLTWDELTVELQKKFK